MASPSKPVHAGRKGSPKLNGRSNIAPPSRRRTSQYIKLGNPDKIMGEAPSQTVPVTPVRSLHRPSLSTSTRKVSAGFSNTGPLSGHPTTAFSTVMATTAIPHPDPLTSQSVNISSSSQSIPHPGPLTSHPVNVSSSFPSSQSHGNIRESDPRRSLRSSQTYSNLPLPTTHHKSYSSSASVARSCTHATAQPTRNRENIPPRTSMASNFTTRRDTSKPSTPRLEDKLSPKKKPKSRLGIPKSRTFNALSNLTTSLSRTSLGQLSGSHSRHTSVSSKSTARKVSGPYNDPSSAASSSSQGLLIPAMKPANPHLIHTAQSSAYWSGRFMALQDRFQSEMLIPENLEVLGHAYAERSFATQPSIASSATMGCIGLVPGANPNATRSGNKSTSPRRPQKLLQQAKENNHPNSGVQPYSQTMAAPAKPSYEAAAALLVDEDNRCRRVFMHLESLCTTHEARNSLRQWQQSYARRMGRESLLPEGGTMYDRTKELTWVGRLFIGSGTGNGHCKKGC